jgi:hypothetical protein
MNLTAFNPILYPFAQNSALIKIHYLKHSEAEIV